MGSFSWNRADNLGKIENIYGGCAFKMLIPKEFGGGFIRDNYQNYGRITDHTNNKNYDMYELVAFWNIDEIKESSIMFNNEKMGSLKYDGEVPKLKECDNYTDYNRIRGIEISCYDGKKEYLDYPLKLVSIGYKGTYEECLDYSYSDIDQGFYPRKRNERGNY